MNVISVGGPCAVMFPHLFDPGPFLLGVFALDGEAAVEGVHYAVSTDPEKPGKRELCAASCILVTTWYEDPYVAYPHNPDLYATAHVVMENGDHVEVDLGLAETLAKSNPKTPRDWPLSKEVWQRVASAIRSREGQR